MLIGQHLINVRKEITSMFDDYKVSRFYYSMFLNWALEEKSSVKCEFTYNQRKVGSPTQNWKVWVDTPVIRSAKERALSRSLKLAT